MLDRLSVRLPRLPDTPDHPAVTGEAERVQSRFWQHLVRLTAPARRVRQIRKGFVSTRGLSLEGVL
ncbi:MAG: hypothetical protein EBS72_15775 [Rhizobiales bacterium]|jgi:hypothetical protein|nr:hypothetical protein [Hyphomicrobiales bacterium]